MNIDDIIKRYEENQDLSQIQQQLQTQAFQENVQALEKHIQEVIKPIFDHVKDQIVIKGYPCKVRIGSKNKPDSNLEIFIYIDSSKLSELTQKPAITEKEIQETENSDFFCYQGKPKIKGFMRYFFIPGNYNHSNKIRNTDVSLSELTKEQIEADLEMYLKDVFPA